MMAGSVDDNLGETELCSHQDVVDCGGTKFDCNGNGNVCHDIGASYVFVSGVGDVNGCGLGVVENCDVKGNGVVGKDQDFAVGMEKEVDLHGEFVGEVVENGTSVGTVEDRVEGEPGEDLESQSGLELGVSEGTVIVSSGDGELSDLHGEFVENVASEGTVEDQVEGEPEEDLESRTGSGLELGVSEGTVVVSADKSELSGKSEEDVEENVVVSVSEVGESEQSCLGDAECELGKVEGEVGEEEAQELTELKSVEGDLEMKDQGNFRQMKDLGSDAEFGESQEGVIILAERGDKSVEAVMQDLVVPPADFEEGNQSNTVALGVDLCESVEIQAGIEVDVGEGKLKDQTELNSVEEILESDTRTTNSVDCVSHDLEENQYKFEHMMTLDSEIDGGVQMGNEIIAVADKGIICTAAAKDFKDLDKWVDGSQSVDKLDLTPSDAATPCSIDKVPIECGGNISAGTDDCAAVEHGASKSVLVQGTGAVNSTELDSNINQMYAELNEYVPVLASVDNGTVSDQGPADADCGVGQVQGHDAERVTLDTNVTLTTETATRSVTDQSKISQINLGEQRSGCTESPKLNGNPDDEAIECGQNITAGTDDCAAVEHEASKSVLVQGIGTVNLTELDSDINQTYAELTGHVPAKICGSALSSIDNGTVLDQGPADADCGVGQVQGYDAERVALDTDGTLTAETATRSVTDQSKISQINLGEQRSGCTESLELNGNPDNEAIECGENISAGTDDCAAVEHEAFKSVLVQGIVAVNSTELDSNMNQTYAELIGHVPAKIFGSVLASIDNGTVSDQGPVDADCGVGQVQGYDTERVVLDTDGTLTTDNATTSVTDQSKISHINLGEPRSGCTRSPELNGNPDNAHSDCIVPQVQSDEISRSDCNGATILEPEVRNLVCPVTDNKYKLKTEHLQTEDVENGIDSVTDGTKSETGVANGLSSCARNDVRSEFKIEFGTVDAAEVVTKSRGRDSLSKSQGLNGDIDCNQKQAIFKTNLVESERCADVSLKSDVQNHSAINRSDMHGKDATVADCSIGDSVDGRSLGNVAKAKPFQFLAKFPRIDDDKLREQIRDAQLLVEEKTVLRNNIRCEIDIKRANLQSLGDEFEATKSDERAARRLVKLKRQEIDSVQDKINRVKNSVSVMDITNRIAHMEHMIEHETHPLKEEMQLLREINLLKKLRGQISSNVCSSEEVTQALSQSEQTEMQLKTLKKELGDLKDKVSKAEAAVILLGKKCNDESKKLRELQARFRAANDIRQDAYKDLLGLKKQLHEKGKHFWIYKDDAKAASDYALNGNKEALYHLCAKQVDTFMDLWNKNDEFREDYVRCNMRSTLRRLKTLDGRSLGPDEEVHVFPVYVGERESRQLNDPSRTTNPSSPTILKQGNTVQPVEREPVDGKSLVMAEPKSKMSKSKTSVNPILESGLHVGSRQFEVEETKEEEKHQTKEELELARKDEMLRKEEIDAKLKEQLRQEEKVKAQEALKRKQRNADKAQMRAVLRAQKEAEQKEKEREKRLKKKEKKTTDGENGLELQTNHIKDESKDSPTTKPSKTSHFNRFSKTKATIPPALRNRGKRRLKQFMWWIFGGLMIVLFIFLVVNGGASKNLRSRKDDSFLGNHQAAQPNWQT